MNKKVFSVFCLTLSLCLLFTGCRFDVAKDEEPLLPGITNPDGRVISETDPKAIEGRVTKLTDDKIWVKVQGTEWKFEISDTVEDTLEIFEENGIIVRKGSMVIVYYEDIKEGVRLATRIQRVTVN